MKKTVVVALAVWLGSFSGVWAAGQEVTVGIKGMVCGFCAQGIKKKFTAEKSVEKVDVSLQEKRVSLSLKEGAELTDERITKIVNDAGYDVTGIEREEP